MGACVPFCVVLIDRWLEMSDCELKERDYDLKIFVIVSLVVSLPFWFLVFYCLFF